MLMHEIDKMRKIENIKYNRTTSTMNTYFLWETLMGEN